MELFNGREETFCGVAGRPPWFKAGCKKRRGGTSCREARKGPSKAEDAPHQLVLKIHWMNAASWKKSQKKGKDEEKFRENHARND